MSTIEDILARSSDPLAAATFDIERDYSDPEPLVSLDEFPLISVGNLSAIVGPPKSRKTFLATMIVAAYLAGDLERLRGMEIPSKVLWVDTEQSPGHCARVYRRINTLRSRDEFRPQSDLTYLMLREYPANERLRLTRLAIERIAPRLVVIDGVADLIEVNNNEVESIHLQDALMSLSKQYQCHILSVIHSNAGTEKGRGHTGANLTRKSELIMTLTPDEKHSRTSVRSTSRNAQPPEFAFGIDPEGLPTFGQPNHRTFIDYETMAMAILTSREYVDYPTIVGRIMRYRQKEGSPVSDRQAKRIVSSLYRRHLLYHTKNGYCRAPARQSESDTVT